MGKKIVLIVGQIKQKNGFIQSKNSVIGAIHVAGSFKIIARRND